MLGQILGMKRRAVAQQVIRRSRHHEANVGQPLSHQPFRLVLIGGEPEIQPLIHQIGSVVEQRDLQLQLGIAILKRLEMRNDVQTTK